MANLAERTGGSAAFGGLARRATHWETKSARGLSGTQWGYAEIARYTSGDIYVRFARRQRRRTEIARFTGPRTVLHF